MSNFNFNKVILGGRLTADPELKQTTSGIPVVSFSIAVNRRFAGKDSQQREVDFFNITAWRATAEFVSRYFKKGSAICVVGSIQNRSYTDQQGQKRFVTDIVADEVQFVDSRSDSASYGQSQGQYTPDSYTPSYSSAPAGGMSAPRFEEIKGDDDLPF
jgi:single-strand DNA-binding protein